MNNPFGVKENDDHALEITFSVLVILDVSLLTPLYGSCFFSECLSDHCQSLVSLLLRFAQNLMHTHCQIHCKITSG
jgi:hypothetical protein